MIEGLVLTRNIDIEDADDISYLKEASQAVPGLTQLMDDYLEDYLRFFKGPDWRKLSGWGDVSVQTSPKFATGFNLDFLLQIAGYLANLSANEGFEELMAGLNNPPQIDATLFEMAVAGWCSTRKVHRSMVFSPKVLVAGKTKHPEFLWQTSLGDIYVECKTTAILENKVGERMALLKEALANQYGAYTWPADVRLDVTVSSLEGDVVKSIAKVVTQCANSIENGRWEEQTFVDRFVSAALGIKGDLPQMPPDSVRQSMAQLTKPGVAQRVVDVTLYSITLDVSKHRQSAVAAAVSDARTQIPEDASGAVFVQTRSRSDAVHNRIQKQVDLPDYARVLWVSLWDYFGPTWAVWQSGQPFDSRLLEPPTIDTASSGCSASN